MSINKIFTRLTKVLYILLENLIILQIKIEIVIQIECSALKMFIFPFVFLTETIKNSGVNTTDLAQTLENICKVFQTPIDNRSFS